MNQEHLETLLAVTEQDNGTWIAMVPEMTSMWSRGATRQAAIEQWASEYDVSFLHPIFASCLQERVAASKLGPVIVTEVKQEIEPDNGRSDQIVVVERLLATYKRAFPWQDKPEHKDAQGRLSRTYYEDARSYSQSCTDFVIGNAKEEGVTSHAYRMSEGTFEHHSWWYVLSRDGSPVLNHSHHTECYDYALHSMQDTDLYNEFGMVRPMTGCELRTSHNKMETYYAKDGSYTPQYIYAPITEEKIKA